MDIVIGITAVFAVIFAVWTVLCLLVKGMFKIADWVFGL